MFDQVSSGQYRIHHPGLLSGEFISLISNDLYSEILGQGEMQGECDSRGIFGIKIGLLIEHVQDLIRHT